MAALLKIRGLLLFDLLILFNFICTIDINKFVSKGTKERSLFMKQEEINRIKNRAVEGAKRYPCESILREEGIATRKRGTQIHAVCYKCGSKSGFSITESKNVFHCFKCNNGGGPARMYADLYGLTFLEASLRLAVMTGDISRDEAEMITSVPDNLKKLNSDSLSYQKLDGKEGEESGAYKAPAKVCDLVYRHLLKLPAFSLDNFSVNYLFFDRHLTGEEIKALGFFHYKESFSIDKLLLDIRKEKPDATYDIFRGIPGFYFRFSNADRSMGCWKFKNPMENTLGIPLRNADGYITALQMRYMGKKPVKNKYFYISSRDVKEKDTLCGFGSTPGTPVHVFFPENRKSDTIYIGEGFFKMNEVYKDGYISLSIQGVNSITYVSEEVEKILKLHPEINRNELKFIIVFDTDMYRKYQVLSAGTNFNSYICKKFPGSKVAFLTWNPELGKGYDDAKFNVLAMQEYMRKNNPSSPFNKNYLKLIPAEVLCNLIDVTLKEVAEEYKITKNSLKQLLLSNVSNDDVASSFGEKLENKVFH